MLEYLKIQNIALIDELEVNFGAGLNILTGETGAGKSILIDSINFVLGGRAGKELIRSGCEFAQVEALVSISGEKGAETLETLARLGFELGEDRSLLLYRHFTAAGKNSCKVNGKVLTVSMLKEISVLLVDIHGQHEHQSLLNSNRHIELLDRLCPSELGVVLEELATGLKKRREVRAEIKSVIEAGGGSIDTLKGQIKEIEKAKLKEGEEETLTERKARALNAEKLTASTDAIARLLFGGDEGVSERLGRAVPYLEAIAETDRKFAPTFERLKDLNIQLRDACGDAAHYIAGVERGENLDVIEQRLDIIYKLKRKYVSGATSTVGDVLKRLDELNEKVEFIENSAELLDKLNEKRKAIEREIAVECAKASKIRKQTANLISAEITDVLKDLGMTNAILEISVERKNEFSVAGFDKVEFMISPNRGEAVKPLSKIASGGEMSRVMLALKTVLARADNIETFIFDEIDAGVSGRTALMVAEKLSEVSKQQQILCITHLPQIAAMAERHYLIAKTTDNEKTTTSVRALSHERSVEELARLIGGAVITETTLRSAGEMKEMAKRQRDA